jgi:hypothetical protein
MDNHNPAIFSNPPQVSECNGSERYDQHSCLMVPNDGVSRFETKTLHSPLQHHTRINK